MIVSSSVYPIPCQYGGLERQVELLANELAKRGHKVAVAAPKGSKGSNFEIIETTPPASGITNWHILEGQAMQIYKYRVKEFDIIHGHNWFGYEYLIKRDNPSLNIKIIHTHHGHVSWRTPPPVPYPNLCAVSNYLANEISSKLGVPVRAVHNAINLSEFKYREDKEDFFLFLGRITKYKQPHVCIDLARRLRFKLIIAGEHIMVEDHNYVADIQRRAADSYGLVTFLGRISNEMRIDLLSRAKAVLIPSWFKEPLGLVSLEAQASGTPVIALNDGGLPETIKHGKTGFVCNSVEEMERAIKKIDRINPKDCRLWVEKMFSADIMCSKYEKLYKQILDNMEW
ncbi:MAG: glycosyltransferase [Nitrososphaerales archaeon]